MTGSPDFDLMRIYRTEKCAGSANLLARMALGTLNGEAAANCAQQEEQKREEATRMTEAFRQLEQVRTTQTVGAINPGMTRIASAIGADMAQMDKAAGFLSAIAKPKVLGPLGLKGTLAAGGLAAGGLYAGSKAIGGATNLLRPSSEGPPQYGPGHYGYSVPAGVNQYGQPQL